MKYRGLIFDLDGTLIDSSRDIVDSWNDALLLCGFPSISPDHFKEPLRKGKKAVLNMVLPKTAPQSAADAVLTAYKACYRQNWNRHTKAFLTVNEILAELFNRGIKCAVLSNKAQDMTGLCCKTFLFTEGLSIVCGASEKYRPKPSPAQALEIRRIFDLPSAEIAMIGDTEIDLQTAASAGFGALLATWSGVHKPSLDALYPFTVLNAPKNILDHVNNFD